ncbi:NO-inducible flavohemoprotein [Bacillus alkalicellulosilyticus]|uniref:NO-inducible flavohemoprotein n=1 Tax=Alkalihalobacterium alkalicellulosilyticum TaxID=1912214 RepID=UPI000998540C|nr:NO-inducible flavohemoprotein [Bacillus alkalicellulosilyticus]
MGTKTLNQDTIEIIKSTVPVLAEHGEAITTRFYQMLFSNHPELLHIFNHANQKKGKQPQALANSIYAAAQYIDNLEAILPVVKQIAHKHRSLNIKPEHYPIVGEHLLLAIKDVLGEAATDDIIHAWGEAYGVIADVFISVEKEMYDEAEQAKGGWKEFRHFIVSKKEKESEVITSFYLTPQDGKEIASFLPGQYISIKAVIEGEEYTHIRQYSLSDHPNQPYYRISVKREDGSQNQPAGIVSQFLHDTVREGDILEVTAPAGDFVLQTEPELPIVLISGGVGQTPLLSMLKTLAQKEPNRVVTYIHAAINGSLQAFDQEVREAVEGNDNYNYYLCLESPTDEDKQANKHQQEGYIDQEWLSTVILDHDAEFYVCGPTPFMQASYQALVNLGVAKEQIHYEFFGPKGVIEN